MAKSNFLDIRFASQDWEFQEIHKLNYKTFVEEIPQHVPNPDGVLVDQFHSENKYLIAMRGTELMGMLTFRDKRPFSLDKKLANLDSYLPQAKAICEIRLLAFKDEYRHTVLFWLLFEALVKFWDEKDYDLMIMSGTVRQLKFYEYLGFKYFGSLVGDEKAMFQPMFWTREALRSSIAYKELSKQLFRSNSMPVNLLPGPVNISIRVHDVLSESTIHHRSKKFIEDFENTKNHLRKLTNTRFVQLLMGSGTLGNDTVAAQISLIPGNGLILSNGEFGDRLIDHARRHRLSFQTLHVNWGEAFTREQIENALIENPNTRWLWAVHCETSTGALLDLEMAKEVSAKHGLYLCLDCMSSIGTIPVDLSGVYLASSVSGKGLASYTGISMIFHDHEILPSPDKLPRYLDLGIYANTIGSPFTFSSNLFYALREAILNRNDYPDSFYSNLIDLSTWVRANLRAIGFEILGDDKTTSPAVITIALPKEINSLLLGQKLEKAGFYLSYSSSYLVKRNLLQIILMGNCSKEEILPLFRELLIQVSADD